jgi:hypothetical protein
VHVLDAKRKDPIIQRYLNSLLDHAATIPRDLHRQRRSLIATHQAAQRVSVLETRSESLYSRPRNNIADQIVINIDQNPRISPLVESRRARAAGSLRSTTADHYTHKKKSAKTPPSQALRLPGATDRQVTTYSN